MSDTAPAARRAHGATTALGWVALVCLGASCGLGLALPKSVEQRDYSRLIAIHPAVAWVSYLAVGVTALAAALWLAPPTRRRAWDRLAVSSLEVGAVFTALTLVTGAIWGRPTWGVYWVWDARLTTEALLLALMLGYLALRRVTVDVDRRALLTSVYALMLVPLVAIIHFSVLWWRTLHQAPSLASPDPGSNLDTGFIAAMLLSFVAFSLVYAWLVAHRYSLEGLEERLDEVGLDLALDQRRAEAGQADDGHHGVDGSPPRIGGAASPEEVPA